MVARLPLVERPGDHALLEARAIREAPEGDARQRMLRERGHEARAQLEARQVVAQTERDGELEARRELDGIAYEEARFRIRLPGHRDHRLAAVDPEVLAHQLARGELREEPAVAASQIDGADRRGESIEQPIPPRPGPRAGAAEGARRSLVEGCVDRE